LSKIRHVFQELRKFVAAAMYLPFSHPCPTGRDCEEITTYHAYQIKIIEITLEEKWCKTNAKALNNPG